MKTLYKTYSHKQSRKKQIELEAQTGVKWDWYRTGQGIRFTPIATKEISESLEAAIKLKPYITKQGNDFISLAEQTGIDLESILRGAWTLARKAQAYPMVNRNGNFAGIRTIGD